MRRLTQHALGKAEILRHLEVIADSATNVPQYQEAFKQIGKQLGELIKGDLAVGESIALVASSEDADWLMSGILDALKLFDIKLAVLWNLRSNPFGNEELSIAPVVKEYREDLSGCNTLVVCKSIIHTSCVVRTNLIHTIEKMNPDKVFILSPVMFKGATQRLLDEFPKEIGRKFQFRYFAEDEDVSPDGSVTPGIGGSVYERLGIGNAATKNKYIPRIVLDRRALQPI